MDSALIGQAVAQRGADLVLCLEAEQHGRLPVGLAEYVERQEPHVSPPEIKDESFHRSVSQFIARKADLLFKSVDKIKMVQKTEDAEDNYAIMPALESFMGIPLQIAKDHFYNSLEKRDIVIGVVTSVLESGLMVTLLCLGNGHARDIHDAKVLMFCPLKEIPSIVSDVPPIESFHIKDIVRGLVLNVNPETGRIIISIHDKSLFPSDKYQQKLGLISEDDFPVHYRRKLHVRGLTFNELLQSIIGFNNSGNVDYLLNLHGLKDSSIMRGLHNRKILEKEYSENLRKWQCQKLALQSVAQGVMLFKKGQQMEAMQHLNKALQIDETNVDALVARGALYANNESFTRAIKDFEAALKVNPSHSNAKNYLLETTLAKGKRFEDQKEYQPAQECYQQAVSLDPTYRPAITAASDLAMKIFDLKQEAARRERYRTGKYRRDDDGSPKHKKRKKSLNRQRDYSPEGHRRKSWHGDEATKSSEKKRTKKEEACVESRKRKLEEAAESSAPKLRHTIDDHRTVKHLLNPVAQEQNPYASIFTKNDVYIPGLGPDDECHKTEAPTVFPAGFCNPQDPNFVQKSREEYAAGKRPAGHRYRGNLQLKENLSIHTASQGNSPGEFDRTHSPKSAKLSKSPFDEEAFLYGESEYGYSIAGSSRKGSRSQGGDWDNQDEQEVRGRGSRRSSNKDRKVRENSPLAEWEDVKSRKVVRLKSPRRQKRDRRKQKRSGGSSFSDYSSRSSTSNSRSRSSSSSNDSSSSEYDKPMGDFYEKHGIADPKTIKTQDSFFGKDTRHYKERLKSSRTMKSDHADIEEIKKKKIRDALTRFSKRKDNGDADNKCTGSNDAGGELYQTSKKRRPKSGVERHRSRSSSNSRSPSPRSGSREKLIRPSKRLRSPEKVIQDSSISSLSERLGHGGEGGEHSTSREHRQRKSRFDQPGEASKTSKKSESGQSMFHISSRWDSPPPVIGVDVKPVARKYENIQISISTGNMPIPQDLAAINIFSGKQLSKYRASKQKQEKLDTDEEEDELERLFLHEKGLISPKGMSPGNFRGGIDSSPKTLKDTSEVSSNMREVMDDRFEKSSRPSKFGKQEMCNRKRGGSDKHHEERHDRGRGEHKLHDDDHQRSDYRRNQSDRDDGQYDSRWHHDRQRHDNKRDDDRRRDDNDDESRHRDDKLSEGARRRKEHFHNYYKNDARGGEYYDGDVSIDKANIDYTRKLARPRGENRKCGRYYKTHPNLSSVPLHILKAMSQNKHSSATKQCSEPGQRSSSSSSSSRSPSPEKPSPSKESTAVKTDDKIEGSPAVQSKSTISASLGIGRAGPCSTVVQPTVPTVPPVAVDPEQSLNEMESFLSDLKDKKKQRWVAEGKIKTT